MSTNQVMFSSLPQVTSLLHRMNVSNLQEYKNSSFVFLDVRFSIFAWEISPNEDRQSLNVSVRPANEETKGSTIC